MILKQCCGCVYRVIDANKSKGIVLAKCPNQNYGIGNTLTVNIRDFMQSSISDPRELKFQQIKQKLYEQ